MKSTIAIAIVAMVGFGAPAIAKAKSMARGHDQAITGCLQSGSGAGQYQLVAQDGNTWKVKPGEYVDLASYVDHTVTVAGPEVRTHGAKQSAKTENSLTVLDVAVDSQSCHE